jgi:hypothetical protein
MRGDLLPCLSWYDVQAHTELYVGFVKSLDWNIGIPKHNSSA